MSFPKRNLEVEHLRLKLVKYELQLIQLRQEGSDPLDLNVLLIRMINLSIKDIKRRLDILLR